LHFFLPFSPFFYFFPVTLSAIPNCDPGRSPFFPIVPELSFFLFLGRSFFPSFIRTVSGVEVCPFFFWDFPPFPFEASDFFRLDRPSKD